MEFENKSVSQITISDTAIAEIVSHVTSECYGIVGLVNPSIKDGIIKILHRDRQSKGVVVKRDEGKINIKIYVIAQYGTNLKEVAKSLRNTVRFNLEKLTYLSIGKIDVYIQKVNIQSI